MLDKFKRFWRRTFLTSLKAAEYWQDRRELDEVKDWWETSSFGVCALIGVGGSGKTAAATRFTEDLGVIPSNHELASFRDAKFELFAMDLASSDYGEEWGGVKVETSTDETTQSSFFNFFSAWLCHLKGLNEKEKPDGYSGLVELINQCPPILVTIDSFEVVQNLDNYSITDGILREFVKDAGVGAFDNVKVLITSRCRLPSTHQFTRQIDFDGLGENASIELLVATGISRRYTDDLLSLAKSVGFHPLALDLLGRFVVKRCGGNPRHLKQLDDWILEGYENRLSSLAKSYENQLSDAEWAVLQRICLIGSRLSAQTYFEMFVPSEVQVSNTKDRIENILEKLGDLGLVEKQMPVKDGLYGTHPAIRTAVIKRINPSVMEQYSNEIADKLLQLFAERAGENVVRKGNRPKVGPEFRIENVKTVQQWNILTEVVQHRCRAGRFTEAFYVYWYLIGGFRWLGWRFGDYERGAALCRTLLETAKKALVPGEASYKVCLLRNEYGLFLYELGMLEKAEENFKTVIEAVEKGRKNQKLLEFNKLAIVAKQNRIMSQVMRGQLKSASKLATSLLQNRHLDDNWQPFSWLCRALCRFLRATVGREKDLQIALESSSLHLSPTDIPSDPGDPTIIHSRSYVIASSILCRYQDIAVAKKLAFEALAYLEKTFQSQHQDIAKCKLVLAEIHMREGNLAAAERTARESYDWALPRDARAVLCVAELLLCSIKVKQISESVADGTADEIAVKETFEDIEKCIRHANRQGFGLYWVEAMLINVRMHLLFGNFGIAERNVLGVLRDGGPRDLALNQAEYSAYVPSVMEMDYVWGIARATHLYAECLLLRAANINGGNIYQPRKCGDEVKELVKSARKELHKAKRKFERLKNPASQDQANPKIKRTIETLSNLKKGILTPYPVEAACEETEEFEDLVLGSGKDESMLDVGEIVEPSCEKEMNMPAVDVWKDKWRFLQEELAKGGSPGERFKILKDIKECEEKIRELSEFNVGDDVRVAENPKTITRGTGRSTRRFTWNSNDDCLIGKPMRISEVLTDNTVHLENTTGFFPFEWLELVIR